MADPKGNLVTPVAFNPSGYPLALEVDASGYLKVATAAAGNFLVGTHGYVGGAWQKNPILFGYSAIVNLNWYNTNLPAGNSGYNSSAVPSGKIWVITNVAICYGGTTPTKIDLVVYRDGIYPMIFNQASPANNIWYDRQGWWVLRAGDVLRSSVYGATAGNALYAQAIGFAVDINL